MSAAQCPTNPLSLSFYSLIPSFSGVPGAKAGPGHWVSCLKEAAALAPLWQGIPTRIYWTFQERIKAVVA